MLMLVKSLMKEQHKSIQISDIIIILHVHIDTEHLKLLSHR